MRNLIFRFLLLILLLCLILASFRASFFFIAPAPSFPGKAQAIEAAAPERCLDPVSPAEPVPDPLRLAASFCAIPPDDQTLDCTRLVAWSSRDGILLSKGDRTKALYPASLTKLVTALVALEYASPDLICTVGDEILFLEEDAAVAEIPEGSEVPLGVLLQAMLLPSGCDAAFTVAANVGRLLLPGAADSREAVAAFVREMNEWSQRNGLLHSHWSRPDGYHDENNYTCLDDMLLVMILFAKDPVLTAFTSLPFAAAEAGGEKLIWKNTNQFVNPLSPYYDPRCFGLKTGQTDEAGGCLASAFRRGDETLLIAIFGNQSRRYLDRFDVTLRILGGIGAGEEIFSGTEENE